MIKDECCEVGRRDFRASAPLDGRIKKEIRAPVTERCKCLRVWIHVYPCDEKERKTAGGGGTVERSAKMGQERDNTPASCTLASSETRAMQSLRSPGATNFPR